MNEPSDQSAFVPPVSNFTGPVAELIAQRMLTPPSRPGILATLDHYEILRVLGGGGMGIVLLGRDADNGQDVAIKLVRSDLVNNQEVVRRFIKEAGHLKRLRHTNIVPVQEISDRPENPYFVTPYFDKGNLAGRIKPGQPLDTDTILDIATPVAEALSFAHRSGIIHRDLKPANVLLGANHQVCLADFGLARSVFNDTVVDVESRQLEGTAPYMSPAVAAGDAEDTRCDIYSFGALLYEMLTGQPPYKGRSVKEILGQIMAGPPKAITSLNSAADRGLVAVAEKAMARELRDRYADMRDILTDLQLIRDGKSPVGQRQPGWCPLVVPIAACLVTILVVAVMLSRSHPAQKPSPVATQPSTPVPARPPVWKTTTLAGQVSVAGVADGAQAQFRLPNDVAVDAAGNVFVADTANSVIRKITPDGTVSTLAGVAGKTGNTDGEGSKARFWAPFGICVDTAGNIFVADSGNNTIREIIPSGLVITLAGRPGHPGNTDGTGLSARFRNPWGVAVDADDNVYVADMSNDTIRKITSAAVVTTLAGQAGVSGSVNGFGTSAQFNNPFGVTVDAAGDVYVADSANNDIRKINSAGVVTTLAGQAGTPGNTDGSGINARFWNPQGITVDAAGNLYVADTSNNAIRKITPAGVVTTIPGTPSAALNNPGGVTVDSAGNLYVADTNNHCVRKIRAFPSNL